MIYEELKQRGMIFTTDIPKKEASYIMEDGKFFDLEASLEIITGKYSPTFICHLRLDQYLFKNKIVDELYNKTLVRTDNAIALNSGISPSFFSSYFVLPEKMPSNAQFESLLNWLTYMSTKNNKIMLKTIEEKKLKIFEFQTLNNENGYLPEEIITEIKKTYASNN